MAYPIRRVLNCQMHPRPPLFAMLCKTVTEEESVHFCHVFHLSSPEQVGMRHTHVAVNTVSVAFEES